MIKFVLAVLSIWLNCSSCNNANSSTGDAQTYPSVSLDDPAFMIRQGESMLQEGDIVLRMNNDPFSTLIRNFSKTDKRYSHTGIVLFDNGKPFIYHILTGDENPDGKIRKDAMEVFCDPRNNSEAGIFRFAFHPEELDSVRTIIHRWAASPVLFDMNFDSDTDDRMYCTEMISKLLLHATSGRIRVKSTVLSGSEMKLFATYLHLPYDPDKKVSVFAVDDIYKRPDCKRVIQFNYYHEPVPE